MNLLILVALCCADFRAEYLPAARKLEQAYSQCRAKVALTVTNDTTDYLGKTSYAFALDGNKAKFDRTIENRENGMVFGFRRAIIGTPELSFMILTKDGNTILEEVSRSGESLAYKVIDQADTVRAAFAFLGKSLSERLASKSFQIKSVSHDDGAVRLDFADVEPDGFAIDGWVRLLSDREWVIDRSEFNMKRGDYAWRRVEQVNYGADDPVPRVASVDAWAYHPGRTDTEKYVIEQLEFGPVPASEFKLSYYGCDDRIGLPRSHVPWFWLAVAGVAIAIVVGITRTMRRGRAQ
jgi:hypothetical protein